MKPTRGLLLKLMPRASKLKLASPPPVRAVMWIGMGLCALVSLLVAFALCRWRWRSRALAAAAYPSDGTASDGAANGTGEQQTLGSGLPAAPLPGAARI